MIKKHLIDVINSHNVEEVRDYLKNNVVKEDELNEGLMWAASFEDVEMLQCIVDEKKIKSKRLDDLRLMYLASKNTDKRVLFFLSKKKASLELAIIDALLSEDSNEDILLSINNIVLYS